MATVYPWAENTRAHVAAKLKELQQRNEAPEYKLRMDSTATLNGVDYKQDKSGFNDTVEDEEERDQVPENFPDLPKILSKSASTSLPGSLQQLQEDAAVASTELDSVKLFSKENKWDAKMFDAKRVGVHTPATEKLVGASQLAAFSTRLEHLERVYVKAFGRSYMEARAVSAREVDRKLEEREDLSKTECVVLERQLIQDILEAIRHSHQPARLSKTLWPSAATIVPSQAVTYSKTDDASDDAKPTVADAEESKAKDEDAEKKYKELLEKIKAKHQREQAKAAKEYQKATTLPSPTAPYFRRGSASSDD